MAWAAHKDLEETREWVATQVAARAAGTDLTWALVHEAKPIGVVTLGGIKWTFRAWRLDRAELGYWMGRPFWGQGLMAEAATAATRWGFETLGLHKITIGCIEGNAASKKIIERIGYRYLCKMEDDVWRDGRWWSHLRYEMTASEWADSTRTLRFNRPVLG
jgi:ribosomal-protein-alanine N-acetyltransferase